MYVLTAQAGEVLLDENGIKVTVMSIKGNQVSLKVDVPEGMSVTREELLDRLQSNKRSES